MNWFWKMLGMKPRKAVPVVPVESVDSADVFTSAPEITAEVEYSLVELKDVSVIMRGEAKILYSDGVRDTYSGGYWVNTGEKAMRRQLEEDTKKHIEYYKKRKAGKGTWKGSL